MSEQDKKVVTQDKEHPDAIPVRLKWVPLKTL